MRHILKAGWTAALAAGTTDSQYVCNPGPDRLILRQARLVPSDAAAANDTNYKTLTFKKASTDVVTPVTTQVTGGVSLVAGTAVDLTVLDVGTSLELAPGECHVFTATHAGTGVAFAGDIVCSYEPIP